MRIGISIENLLIVDQWRMYSRLLDLLDPLLEQVLRDWEQEVEQQAERIDDEYTLSQFNDFLSEEYQEHLQIRVILMNSLFATSFAMFENQLMWVCHVAERNSGSPFSVSDLGSRSPTDRARTYLTKLGVEFPSDSHEWQNITRYREIRNKIMHNGGHLGVEGDLAKFAGEQQILHSGSLELTRAFCDKAGREMKQLLLGDC